MIYELHVGALGFGKPDPGTLDDAIALLDHLTSLAVNVVGCLADTPIGNGYLSTPGRWAGRAQVSAIHRNSS